MSRDEARAAILAGEMGAETAEDWYLGEPVPHREWERLLARLTTLRPSAAREPVVAIVGAAGVGKSALMKETRNLKNAMALERMRADRRLLPAIYLEAEAPTRDEFDWAAYLRAWYRELQEPDRTVRMPPAAAGYPQRWGAARKVEDPYFADVGRRARARHLEVALSDELRHLAWQLDERSVRQHLDRLKSLANQAGCVIVAAVAYDGLELWNLNGQLLRRVERLHFPRYSLSEPDVAAFREALDLLVERLPLSLPAQAGWEWAYEGSMGCVGLLAQWFAKALGLAVEEGAHRLSRRHLAAKIKPQDDLERLLREAKRGEARMRALETARTDARRRAAYRKELGFIDVPSRDEEPAPSERPLAIHARRPFERTPTRDPVAWPRPAGESDGETA